MSEASQEVEVTVEGTITRLMPCPQHAASPPRAMVLDDGMRVPLGGDIPAGRRVARNPNGFSHDCPNCAATPAVQETLERTVTRHVL